MERSHRVSGVAAVLGVLGLIALAMTACTPTISTDTALSSSVTAHTSSTNVAQDFANAEGLRFTGQCDKAIPLYLRAIDKNRMYVHAYDGLGLCYANIGSYDAAIVELDKAIQIDPTQFGLYLDRAGVEAQNGSTGAAQSDDLIALQLATQEVPSYVSIANSFASYGDFADAIKAYSKAIALVPANPSLYEGRARIYLQAQDAPHAFADYQRAIKVAPFTMSRASIYSDLADVYSQLGDYNSAAAAMSVALRLQPDNLQYYQKSGDIQQSAGNLIAALHYYDHALRLAITKGDMQTAHQSKGDVLIKLNRVKEGVAEYRAALRLVNKHDKYTQAVLKSKIQSALSGQ